MTAATAVASVNEIKKIEANDGVSDMSRLPFGAHKNNRIPEKHSEHA